MLLPILATTPRTCTTLAVMLLHNIVFIIPRNSTQRNHEATGFSVCPLLPLSFAQHQDQLTGARKTKHVTAWQENAAP